jgi:LuxR family transcriptional regulator, maltose regulon positive regulatory protein
MVTSTATRPVAGSRRPVAGVDCPVLTSKIVAPGLPRWIVPRSRIERHLAEGAHGPLTVVTGPPGAGKTVAIASWAARHRGRVAWVTLDDYDNRPGVFWSYVAQALRRAGATVPRTVSAPASLDTVDHGFLVRFAAAMAAQQPPVTLVLDDLQHVTAPAPLAGLAYVLTHARPGLRLVVSSRIDPFLPLHRYRLAGELAELRAADLAFDVREARLLMAQHGITLPAELLEALTKRAEGWAAGLRLAAISMRGNPDPEQFIKNMAAEDGAVVGYLVAEVLDAQPPHVRDLMLKTSIVDRISGELAAELADDQRAGSALAAMAQTNAFVQPLGRGWYRYHSLFGAVLRLKLRRECPGALPDLHRRAARWYQRNGSLADAVGQAARAGDWQLAARMAVDDLAAGQLIGPRGSRPLADLFRTMPPCGPRAQAQLLLVDAALALPGVVDDAGGASLRAAESALGQLPADAEVPSRLAAAAIRLAAARRDGDLAAAAAAAAQAEDLLDRVPCDLLTRHPEVRAQVLSGRGSVELWSGHLDAAATIFEGAAADAVPGSAHERADCLGNLALLEAIRGRLSRAAAAATAAARTTGNDPAAPMENANAPAEIALAWVHLERGELAEARGRLKRANTALRARPDKLAGALACLAVAGADLAEGRPGAAVEMTSRARRGWSPPPWLEDRLALAESRACAAKGDIKPALEAAGRVSPESSHHAFVARAHAWLAAGDLPAATDALAQVPLATGEVPDRVRVQASLAEARARYSGGDMARGRRALANALRLAAPEQLRLPFAIERAWLRPILRRDPVLARAHGHLLEAGPATAELATAQHGTAQLAHTGTTNPAPVPTRGSVPGQRGPVPGQRGPVPGQSSPAPAQRVLVPGQGDPVAGHTTPVIIEQLSSRECEVLRHASKMLSTAEIATEMYISVNTVKTHLKSIYRKLAAPHRREAVRRAQELRLI